MIDHPPIEVGDWVLTVASRAQRRAVIVDEWVLQVYGPIATDLGARIIEIRKADGRVWVSEDAEQE